MRLFFSRKHPWNSGARAGSHRLVNTVESRQNSLVRKHEAFNLQHQTSKLAARSQRGTVGPWILDVRCWMCLFALFAVCSTNGQVLQQWTHSSTSGESSAAVALDTNYMVVANNEDETLRLYNRFPASACPAPVYSFNVRPSLNLTSTKPEDDIEAAARSGNRIYWLGSHSNSKAGDLRPNRYRLFATQISGVGTGSPPYSLSYVGRYDNLRTDLIAWDQNNLH